MLREKWSRMLAFCAMFEDIEAEIDTVFNLIAKGGNAGLV